jgi:aminoglycoside phosphotransferase (APT) family kinase protein
MSTIGHPLADIVNLLTPYTTASIPFVEGSGRVNRAFIPGSCPGLPPKDQIIAWYTEVSGYDPSADISWGEAFSIYKGTIIIQGIAARYAMRVASSARAKEFASQLKPHAEVGWMMIERLTETTGERSKI